MPWSNPIIGGNGELIRESIHSPSYVAGVTGWSINKDGSAEFNNVTVRGDLVIIDPVTGRGVIIRKANGTLQLVPPTSSVGITTITNGQLRPSNIDVLNIGYNTLGLSPAAQQQSGKAVTAVPDITLYSQSYDNVSSGTRIIANAKQIDIGTTNTTDVNINAVNGGTAYGSTLTIEPTMLINAGMIYHDTVVAAVSDNSQSGTVTTTEAVVLTAGSFTFKAGRVYRAEVEGTIIPTTAATDCVLRIRKTSAAGQQLGAVRFSARAVTSYNATMIVKFTVNPSADVTATLTATLQSSTVTSDFVHNGSTTATRSLAIYDIGSASAPAGQGNSGFSFLPILI